MGKWAFIGFLPDYVFCHFIRLQEGVHACGRIFSCVFAIQIDYVENLITTLNLLCGSQKAVLEFDFCTLINLRFVYTLKARENA